MKTIILLLTFISLAFSQQLNQVYGVKASGVSWDTGLTFIDTTAGTTNDIIIDLADWYPGYDLNPLIYDSVTVLFNSDRTFIGTFYVIFDNQGLKAPTTDSVLYTVKAYPGVYQSSTKTPATAKFGAAVTLETIATVDDYLSITEVYLKTAVKLLPPEVIKLEIAPIDRKGNDDSTAVDWKFVYPAIYQTAKERK